MTYAFLKVITFGLTCIMALFIVLISINIFIWWRMLSDLKNRPKVARIIVIIVSSVLSGLLLFLIGRILSFNGEFSEPRNIASHLDLGAMVALLVSMTISYLTVGIITLLLRPVLHKKIKDAIWVNAALAGLLIMLFTDGYFRQRFNLKILRKDIFIESPGKKLDGLKIAFISDLHLATFYGHYDKLNTLVDSVNSFRPDIMINGGDFISYGWQEFGRCDTILKKVQAPSGSFAVTGNHDDGTYYPFYNPGYGRQCIDTLKKKISKSGYLLLSDTAATVTYNKAMVSVSGVTTKGHHLNITYGDFNKALAHDSSALSVLILHDPAGWDKALASSDPPDLTLSGHTHGMQLGLPVPGGYISPSALFHKYWRGYYSKGRSQLYVTSGIGDTGMAERIFMPPEIILLTIREK